MLFNTWNLSSPTRDGTYATCSGSAFTVTRNEAEVAIRIALPDDMAKHLFTQFAAALQEEIRPFAVPDKLK